MHCMLLRGDGAARLLFPDNRQSCQPLHPLLCTADTLPNGRVIYRSVLTYKLSVQEAGSYKPYLPAFQKWVKRAGGPACLGGGTAPAPEQARCYGSGVYLHVACQLVLLAGTTELRY
jgi:hypothetical protein